MATTTIQPTTEPRPARDYGDDDVIHIVVDWAITHWVKRVVLRRVPVPLCGADLRCPGGSACGCGRPNLPDCPKCLIEDALS